MAKRIKGIQPEAPFDRKLDVPLIGMPKWVEDTELALDNHVFYEHAPEPHTLEALLRRLEELHAEMLDRSLPLWELHIFDRLEDRVEDFRKDVEQKVDDTYDRVRDTFNKAA